MSNKEVIISSIQQLPDDSTVEQILAFLRGRYGQAAASVESSLDWDRGALAADEWRLFVAQRLRDELNDPREDIYSLEDGEPINGQG